MECPHCASSDFEVVHVEFGVRPALAVCCKECGAFGPPAHGTMLNMQSRRGISGKGV